MSVRSIQAVPAVYIDHDDGSGAAAIVMETWNSVGVSNEILRYLYFTQEITVYSNPGVSDFGQKWVRFVKWAFFRSDVGIIWIVDLKKPVKYSTYCLLGPTSSR